MKKSVLFGIGMSLVMFSCSKDKEKPTIEVASPANEQEFHPGESIDLEATFKDNESLKEYRLDIHLGGDHDHGKMQDITGEFDYEKVGELSGTEKSIDLLVDIPMDADTGHYDLVLECTDEEGNEADLVFIEFEIHED